MAYIYRCDVCGVQSRPTSRPEAKEERAAHRSAAHGRLIPDDRIIEQPGILARATASGLRAAAEVAQQRADRRRGTPQPAPPPPLRQVAISPLLRKAFSRDPDGAYLRQAGLLLAGGVLLVALIAGVRGWLG